MATNKSTPTKTKQAKKNTPRGDNKTQKVIAMLKRASGCTREQVLKATSWKAVSMQQMAAAGGLKLKTDKSERPFVYRA